MQDFLSNRLNSVIKKEEIKGSNLNNADNLVTFYEENQLEKALLAVAPYLKVAVFSCQTTFLKYGKQLVDKIKNAGNKAVCYIVADDFSLSTSSACGAFNLAEDIRAVVVTDVRLIELALYFSTIRGVGVVFLSNFSTRALEKSVNVINGSFIDRFNLSTQRHIILKGIDYPSVFAQLTATLFALIEYFPNSNVCSDYVDLQISRAEGIIKHGEKEEQLITLVQLYYQKLVQKSCGYDSFLYSAEKLLGQPIRGGKALYAVNYLIKLISAEKCREAPDYNELAQKIRKFSAENLSTIVGGINSQLKSIAQNREQFYEYQKRITRVAKRLKADYALYQSRYVEMGGQKIELNKREKFAIKHAGATAINAATVIRENFI